MSDLRSRIERRRGRQARAWQQRLLLCGSCCLFAAAPAAESASSGDYLSPDLRARVEKLKADQAFLPTDTLNMGERSRILWQWANAWALDGGELPVNLTQAVGAVAAYPELARDLPRILDDFIFELTLLDEQPDAIGSLVADPGPFEARQHVTIRQTYTVGSRAIESGGGFLVARHFMPNYGVWQTTDPAADNYLTIQSSNGSVAFDATTTPMRGMHGGFRAPAAALVFRLAQGRLEPGDEVVFTYGDRSSGSRGFLMADFSSDRMPLPLYLAFTDDEPFLTLPIQPIVVTGTAFSGLHGFAPSVVRPGETFTLSVRGEDAYRNRAKGGHPAVTVRHGDQVVARVPANREAISLIELSFEEPGIYYLELATKGERVTGVVNPILVSADRRERIFWGDTHGHSGFAEGIGTPDRFMSWARDDARLDYVTHSEHDIWMDDAEWEVLRNNVRRYSRDGEFIAYLGYEWTVRNFYGGHHNVLYRTPEGRDRIPIQFYPTLSQLYQGLRNSADTGDVVVIPHAHQAGDYRQNDPELEPLVEIMSQHGSFEWFGRMYLKQGHQVGFIAASDNHLSQPGYSAPKSGSLAQRGGLGAILAREKTTDAIFDAMKALRTYATTGDRMILEVEVNGTGMGERAPFSEERQLKGRVIGTAPIESITVIKNDAVLWSRDYLSQAAEKLASEESMLLSFGSDAEPYHPGDNPRGWRHWRGSLTVTNGTLVGFKPMDFHNQLLQTLSADPEVPNRLNFTTLTRGDTSSIALDLEAVKRNTAITLELKDARESGGAPPAYRPAQTTPAATVDLPLKALTDSGTLEVEVDVGDYRDRVLLRRQIKDGATVVEFEVTDSSDRQGDYYFVRVRQANDAMAWSSPIWVGGFGTR
ncbi:MAG: DUF3604 domain-containing protein [Pseudomonadota bacterium]